MEIPQELWRKNYEESQILTSDNLAAAKRNGKWGFVNQNGKEICPFKYDGTFPFINGTAAVKIGNLWGVLNTAGKEIVPVYYDQVFTFSEGLIKVKKNGKFGFVNTKG